MKLQELEEREHMLIVREDGEEWVMLETGAGSNWLAKYHPDAVVMRVAHMAPPKGVHAVVALNRGRAKRTGCAISARRKAKYGQNLLDAFQVVDEDVTCPTCIRAVKDAKAAGDKVLEGGVVLRPWSWDNVPEAYRPGGEKYHWGAAQVFDPDGIR